MIKIGRNEPCPCGSGRKYKKCHGCTDTLDRLSFLSKELPQMRARAQAAELQRMRQQGVGKPIISTELDGYRMIAVRNKVHYSKSWKTFHDFLCDYIKIVMGKEWWLAEVQKAADQRHTILRWAEMLAQYQETVVKEKGQVASAPMTGAVAAYLHLAYDLYAFNHANDLQDRLIARLKNEDNFAGARYEVIVAAKMLRAGFELDLEDESDGSTTHVEFIATHKMTGRKFSVEAKQRDASRIRINRLLYRALTKNAAYPRIVFLDINEPDVDMDTFPPKFLKHAEGRLRSYERDRIGSQLPPAYVVVTNAPWHFSLKSQEHRCSILVHGFRIPELQMGHQFKSIREAADARNTHIEIHELMKSMQEHIVIPSTFDGEIPEFAFGQKSNRLLVGERYSMLDGENNLIDGVLESAIVMEQWRQAACVLKLVDERRVICKAPLSAEDLQAWKAHPDTFFGVVDRNAARKPVKTPLDWYDFFYESYQHTPRDKLLEFMAQMPDHTHLTTLDQMELARVYCERMAGSVIRDEAKRMQSVDSPNATSHDS